MEFVEGSRGVYKSIRVLFDTPIYERAKQICWHIQSFKVKVAVVAELLNLQQKKQLPSELTVEDMTDLLLEESKKSLRVQLWEFEMDDFDEEEVKPLLKLVWEVNTSMQRRDVGFQAKRLIDSPEDIPPSYKHQKILSQAHKYARILVEQQQDPPISKLLSPQEVVLDLVPRVLQGLWVPKRTTSSDMPSQKLSEMAVSVTKAVLDGVSTTLMSPTHHQVTYSRSERDDMVLSIEGRVRKMYPPDTLRRKLNSFEAKVLKGITSVAVEHICVLFEPQTHSDIPADELSSITSVQGSLNRSQATQSPALPVTLLSVANVTASVLEGKAMDVKLLRDLDSANISLPSSFLTPRDKTAFPLSNAELPGIFSVDEQAQQTMPCPEPEPAMVQPQSLHVTMPPEVFVNASVLGSEVADEQPKQEPELNMTLFSDSPLPSAKADEPSAFSQAFEEEPLLGQKSNSAETLLPLPPDTLPAKPPVMISVLGCEVDDKQPSQDQEPAVVQDPALIGDDTDELCVIAEAKLPDPLQGKEPHCAARMWSRLPPPDTQRDKTPVKVSVLWGQVWKKQPIEEAASLPALPPNVTIADADKTSAVTQATQEPPPESAEVQTQSRHVTPPTEPPVYMVSVLGSEVINKQPSRRPALRNSNDVVQDEIPESGIQSWFGWFGKAFYCCIKPEKEA